MGKREHTSIAIIGGGFAGLCAGIYAQKNGYRAHVYEMHSGPGGLCTAWHRQGYTIDYCINWLLGSAPGGSFHRLLEEVGLIQDLEIVNLDEFFRFESDDGRTAVIYRDLDRLEEHLCGLSSADAPLIREFLGDARRLAGKDMPADLPLRKLMTPWEGLRALPGSLPLLRPTRKWGGVTMGALASRFRDPLLRRVFADIFYPCMSAVSLLFVLAWLNDGIAGYPLGGSAPLARAVEKRFLELGGEITYGARVQEIMVEADRAVGLRLQDGERVRADHVISAADGHATLWDLLDGRFLDERFLRYYETYPPFPGIVFVALGVNRDCSAEPHTICGWNLPLGEPWTYGSLATHAILARVHNFDPTLAPAGKSIITALFDGDHEYWSSLRRSNHDGYRVTKEEVAQKVIARLDRRLPGLASQVEMVDVATPATTERYTGNWRGSMEGWMTTPENLREEMPRTLTGLDGFCMAGQWVSPGGGIPGGVKTGRDAIQLICHEDGVRFTGAG
ncbi:MAG: NAD(P)/FAD-dependent oxidoreductase [Gaiellales bacterium]|nr:NAD(P)/FAD-dependent oxidoreductase [Gaiellales bacterium]